MGLSPSLPSFSIWSVCRTWAKPSLKCPVMSDHTYYLFNVLLACLSSIQATSYSLKNTYSQGYHHLTARIGKIHFSQLFPAPVPEIVSDSKIRRALFQYSLTLLQSGMIRSSSLSSKLEFMAGKGLLFFLFALSLGKEQTLLLHFSSLIVAVVTSGQWCPPAFLSCLICHPHGGNSGPGSALLLARICSPCLGQVWL